MSLFLKNTGFYDARILLETRMLRSIIAWKGFYFALFFKEHIFYVGINL